MGTGYIHEIATTMVSMPYGEFLTFAAGIRASTGNYDSDEAFAAKLHSWAQAVLLPEPAEPTTIG